MAFVVVLLIFLLVWGMVQYGNYRVWKYRPERLCMNCRTKAQPLQHKDKRWYCLRCQADNPVPLDSPTAREYFGTH